MNISLLETAWIHDENGTGLEGMLKSLGARVHDAREMEAGMERIDALVIGSAADAKAKYLVALASSQKKPVLWIVRDKREEQGIKKTFSTVSDLVVVRFDPQTLSEACKRFFAQHATIEEKPTIKFTLRITPAMDKYLQWKSKQTGLSKADFLRETIQSQIIDQDQAYTNE